MTISATHLAEETALPENKLVAELCEKLSEYLEQNQIDEVVKAFEFGRQAHIKQFRKSGEAYICHPLSVALSLSEMRMDVNGLIEPHHSLGTPPESMYDMMSILRAKPGKNNLPMIRFPIAICVFQKKDIIAVGYINAPVPGKYTGWNMEIIRKNRMFVSHSVTGRVFENNQLIRLLLTWFNMRV